MEIPKTARMKNAEKTDIWQEQLAQEACSQIVSFFSFLCFFQFCILALKNYKDRGFSQKAHKKNTRKNKKKQKKTKKI